MQRAATPDQSLPGLDQLRSLREGKGIAIEALARTVGISPSYLALIESGERQPDAAIRRSLAWELTVAWIRIDRNDATLPDRLSNVDINQR